MTLSFAVSRALAAQATPDSHCTYHTCALRYERGFIRRQIVRGANGEVVGSVSGKKGIAPLLAGSDSARTYAMKYEKNRDRAGALSFASLVALGVAYYRSRHSSTSSNTDAALAITGGTLAIISIPVGLAADRDLARSVWWYNASLPR
jgi:hypothetical protein